MPLGTEPEFNAIMREAEALDWGSSHSFAGKAKTAAYFKARKLLVRSPAKLPAWIVGKIPILGGVVKMGVNAVTGKIRAARIKKGIFAATGVSTPNTDGAKALLKGLQLIAANVDESVTKQGIAVEELRVIVNTLRKEKTETTAEEWEESFWAAACLVARIDSLSTDIIDRVEDIDFYMNVVKKHQLAITEALVLQKTALKTTFMKSEFGLPAKFGDAAKVGRPASPGRAGFGAFTDES